MKKSIKKGVTGLLFRVYYPVMLRMEKWKAVRMWREGVRQCEKMYKEIGSPRVYLFFDANHGVWAPMTYEPNKKMQPSLRQLRVMGKLRGSERVCSVEDMKKYSYYYTPSKWGALGCAEDNRVRTEKLRLWTAYYLLSLSEPMRKCQEYLRQDAQR